MPRVFEAGPEGIREVHITERDKFKAKLTAELTAYADTAKWVSTFTKATGMTKEQWVNDAVQRRLDKLMKPVKDAD